MYYLHTIRQLREDRRWSREEVADRLGVSPRLVAAWEEGTATLDTGERARLAALFLVPPAQLTTPDPARWPRG